MPGFLAGLATAALPSLITAGGALFRGGGGGGGPAYGPGGSASTKQQAQFLQDLGDIVRQRFRQPPTPFTFQDFQSPYLAGQRSQLAGGVGNLFGLAGRAAGPEGFALAQAAQARALGGFGGLTPADLRTFTQGRDLFREGLTQRGLNLGPAGAGLEGDFTNRFLQDIAQREFDRQQAALGLAGQLGGQAFGRAGELGQAAFQSGLGFGGFEQGQEAFQTNLQQIREQIRRQQMADQFDLAQMFLGQRLSLVPNEQSVRLLGESPENFFGTPGRPMPLPPPFTVLPGAFRTRGSREILAGV